MGGHYKAMVEHGGTPEDVLIECIGWSEML